MTAKIGSMFKIWHVNPISGAKSLVRAAKHKLNSGGKRDITNVRSENPSQADGPTQAKRGEFAAAKDCLGYLKDSKGENANFLQAFEKADELTDLCFKAHSGKGYNAFEETIVKDLKTWLRNYDARDVKNIAKQAETAKGFAFIGNVDNLTVASRQRFMKKVVEACSARQKELKNPKKAPSSRSNDSDAAPNVKERELSFRAPAAKPAPSPAEAQPTPAPEKPNQTEAVTEAREQPNELRRSTLIGHVFDAAFSGVAADYIDALNAFLDYAEATGDDVAALAHAVTKESPENRNRLQQAFAGLYENLQESASRLARLDPDYQPPAYYRLAGSLATARPASEVTTERNPHLKAAVKLILQIDRGDVRGFVKSLDEIGELAPEEQAMRLKAIKFAFAKQPPQPESLAAIKGKLHRLLTNKTNVNTHPERVAKLWTTWLALQSIPALQSTPQPAAPRRDPHVVAAVKLIAAINTGDFQEFLRSLNELNQLTAPDELAARYKAMKFAFENRPPQNEGLEIIKASMVNFLSNPALVAKHQGQVEEIRRAWLTVQTFFPERRQETPVVDAHDLQNSISTLNIPKFLKTLHAIGQVADPRKREELYVAIESADFSKSGRFSIERLNALMTSVAERLTKDKDFDVQNRQRIDEICRTWLDLKKMNAALNSSSRKAAPKEDLMVAKEVLAGLLPPPTRP